MNTLDTRLRGWLLWLLPFVVLALLIGWESDWGRAFQRVPEPEAAPVPTPVTVALLPEYTIAGGPESLRATADRTLFNPTRRPAPVAVAEVAKTQIRRGQFLLTGTTVFGDKGIAYLKETSGGKARSVKRGDTINGMLVAEVKADRVKFTLGDDSEELVLKVAAGPKMTIQPAVAPPGGGAAGGGAAGGTAPEPAARPVAAPPAPAGGQAQVATGGVPATPQSLAERRRAARAAEAAAAQQGSTTTPATSATANPATVPPGGTSTWSSMQQQYQQRYAAPSPK
jgi:hypothetical protein